MHHFQAGRRAACNRLRCVQPRQVNTLSRVRGTHTLAASSVQSCVSVHVCVCAFCGVFDLVCALLADKQIALAAMEVRFAPASPNTRSCALSIVGHVLHSSNQAQHAIRTYRVHLSATASAICSTPCQLCRDMLADPMRTLALYVQVTAPLAATVYKQRPEQWQPISYLGVQLVQHRLHRQTPVQSQRRPYKQHTDLEATFADAKARYKGRTASASSSASTIASTWFACATVSATDMSFS